MSLLVIVLALLIEQAHALPVERAVRQPVAALCAWLEERFNDGDYDHGRVAWAVGALLPAILLLIVHALLAAQDSVLAFLLALGVLYLTMGFRQFSHFFSEIQIALQNDDIDQARRLLAQWRQRSGDRLTRSDVARLAIEEALIASHRHVFAPLFWFVLIGPAGAVLYRLADLLRQHWADHTTPDSGDFGRFSAQAFSLIDWLPVRLTAIAFAIVGDFEDAVNCWRHQAHQWADMASGILLASGAGALGVRLGLPVPDPVDANSQGDDRPELGLGDEADPDFMQRAVGLVWRTLILILLVTALLWFATLIGA